MSRLIRLPTEALTGLTELSTLEAAPDANDTQRTLITRINAVAAGILALPEQAVPDVANLQAELEHATRETVHLQRVIDYFLAENRSGEPPAPREKTDKLPDIPVFTGNQADLQHWIDQL